ncbi:MAG: outer membrane protein assembly factor BamA [Endomicrobium sp.]|jgi:outer membrane protein insertion porin family|nr:outer membrane protein assembly factor BamA [Endomicrobium sp.]
MKIRLFFVLCVAFLSVRFAFAKIDNNLITNVVINGLYNVKSKKIIESIKLKKNKIYLPDIAKADIKSILKLGYFEDVKVCYDKDNKTIMFSVKEKPYISQIFFHGNSKFSTNKLKKLNILKEGSYFDVLKLEASKTNILNLYKKKGYFDCQIEVNMQIDINTNKMIVTFFVTEKSKIIVDKIKFTGVIYFTEKKIVNLMKTKIGKTFQEKVLKTDITLIEKFYKNNGFIDYQFINSTIIYDKSLTKVSLTLNINEGIKYKIGDVSFTGNSAIDDNKFEKKIKFKKNQIFSEYKITETIQDIYDAYFNKGYLNTIINYNFKKNDSSEFIDVNLSVDEKYIVYVGNVFVNGLVSTKDKVIKREILLKPSDVLIFNKIHKSIDKIYNLGFIEKIDYNLIPSKNLLNVLDISFHIVESRAGTISGGIGYSTIDKFISLIQLQHVNLFGLGQKLNLEIHKSKTQKKYSIDWINQYIFDKNISLNLKIFNFNINKDYASVLNAYTESRKGITAKIGPKINDNISVLFGYSFEYTQLYNLKSEIENKIDVTSVTDLSKNKISSFFIQYIYDSRNYILDPSKGSNHIANLQLASTVLGGDTNFYRATVKSISFFPIFLKVVLSLNTEFGIITAYGTKSEIPIYEKFYIGSVDTVRGYKYGTEIGSTNGNKVMAIANVECKFPIFIEKGRSVFQGIIFYDIGGGWNSFKHINLKLGNEKKKLHSSIGVGIKILTPILPVRFDWGFGFNHKKGSKLHQFYFTFGNTF